MDPYVDLAALTDAVMSAAIIAKKNYMAATVYANDAYDYFKLHNMIPTWEKPILYDLDIKPDVKQEAVSRYRYYKHYAEIANNSFNQVRQNLEILDQASANANKSVLHTALEDLRMRKLTFANSEERIVILDAYVSAKIRETTEAANAVTTAIRESSVGSHSSYGVTAGMSPKNN
jgi:hypothetical protein